MDKKYRLYYSSNPLLEKGIDFSDAFYEVGKRAYFKVKGHDEYLNTSVVKEISKEGNKLRIKTKNSEYLFLVI